MKKTKFLALACLMVFATSTAVACSKTDSSTPNTSSSEEKTVSVALYTDANDVSVAVAGTKQLRVTVENGNATDVVYEVVSGPATVTANGVVTVNTTASVNDKIVVVAKIGAVTSNSLELTVVDAVATAMTVTPSATTIAKGQSITFSASFTPAHATTRAYTLSIDGDNSFAEITDGVLRIKSDAQPAQINGRQIAVKATLTANSAVFAYTFVTVSEQASVTYLSCETLNFIANKDVNKSIVTEAYSWNGEEMSVSASELTYEGYDEEIVTVDAQGKITAKGHGSTVVTVKYGTTVSTQCVVNVMVAPESIRFENINAHVSNVGTLHYAMGEGNYLDLGVSSQTKTGYLASTDAVTYKFEHLDNAETNQDVAVVTADGISFKQTGRVQVTVLSNSSLQGYEVNESYETKKSIIVNVNDGVNLYTIADLKEYAKNDYVGKTANILANLYLDDNNHFGDETNRYKGLTLNGSRTLQGNGYVLSAERLSRGELNDTDKHTFLHFVHLGNNPFSVALYDLTLLGNVNIEGKHKDGTDIKNGTDLKNNYYRAIEFAGVDANGYDAGNTSAILESAIAKNVTVKGFYTALRYEHAINAVAEDVLIGDCYANGIENVQSHLLVKNVEIEPVGAFGIEISSDDMRGHKTPSVAVSGTAGRQYNETATIRYEGNFLCANYNNGGSTEYMKALATELGMSINALVEIVTGGLVKELSNGDTAVENKLLGVLYQTLMNEKSELNFSTLIFVNPDEFVQYLDKGNTENKFCEFSTTEKINVRTLLENCIANPNYDITEKKFLILDLANLPLVPGASVNLGQVILINNAYQA